jgi:hypothetical protein
MVWLDHMIQVFALAEQAAASEYAFALEFLHGRRLRSVLVHVDYPRLGGCCIALGREQEIDRLPGGIYGSV